MPPSFNKLAAERGYAWALALWEPSPEEREAEAAAYRELGRKIAEAYDAAIMEAVFGPAEGYDNSPNRPD